MLWRFSELPSAMEEGKAKEEPVIKTEKEDNKPADQDVKVDEPKGETNSAKEEPTVLQENEVPEVIAQNSVPDEEEGKAIATKILEENSDEGATKLVIGGLERTLTQIHLEQYLADAFVDGLTSVILVMVRVNFAI